MMTFLNPSSWRMSLYYVQRLALGERTLRVTRFNELGIRTDIGQIDPWEDDARTVRQSCRVLVVSFTT